MPLTKQYLRYEPVGLFGVAAAKNCNAVFLSKRFIITGGTDAVLLWDIRLKRKVHAFTCESPAVILQPNHEGTMLAVGHSGGGVSIYDLQDKSEEASPDPTVTFEGHTSDVLALEWDPSGTVLVSGGKDTKVILWDCVAESGIVKLKGHKGPVTRIRFTNDSKYVISSSTDTTIRIWDFQTHICIHTLPANSEIWDFALWGNYIFVGQNSIRVYKVFDYKVQEELPEGDESGPITFLSENEKDPQNEEIGTIQRNSTDRVRNLQVVNNKFLVVSGAISKEIQTHILNHPGIAERKRRTRIKKAEAAGDTPDQNITVHDLCRPANSVFAAEKKSRSVNVYEEKDGTLQILACLPSNQVQILSCNPNVALSKQEKEQLKEKKPELYGFDGHRKIVRGLAFSSDRGTILSASGDAFKLWHRESMSCLGTVKHEYPAVCCQFCPGDRHFVAGTTCGKIILVDVAKSKIIQTEQIGEENVWSLDMYPDSQGFVASNGGVINCFDFSMNDGILRFDLQRQFTVGETILCIKVSRNMRFIAVGLIDSTIKVYYFDTLKFHLQMYGHNLPVVDIDISADNNLLVSASADKTIRIWGLDFGDCHSSMIHTDMMAGVGFLENTHHVLSAAKDSINYYDGDSHQRIQTIKSHVDGGYTCMALGGLFVVASGRDNSIRLFKRTDEILVLDDERERERDEDMEKEAIHENPNLPSLQTADTEKMADKLIEALDVFKDNSDAHPLLQAYGAASITEFMTKVLSTIKAVELEQSIMLLPVSYVHQMIPALENVLMTSPLYTELAIKCLTAIVNFHLVSLRTADKEVLSRVADVAQSRVVELTNRIGLNVAGLKFIQETETADSLARQFANITETLGEVKRKKKLKDKVIKRALLQVSQMS